MMDCVETRSRWADVNAPEIGIEASRGAFYVFGSGFMPGSSVSITYNYEHLDGQTTNSGFPASASVFDDGSFCTIVYVSTLLHSGILAVEVANEGFPDLNATASGLFQPNADHSSRRAT